MKQLIIKRLAMTQITMTPWKIIQLAFLSAMISLPAHAQMQEVDGVVAVVNKGVILKSDVIKELKNVHINARNRNQQLPPKNELQNQVIEKLILDKIQLQEAERLSLMVDDNRVDDAIKGIMVEQGISQETISASMQRSGLTYNDFREQIRREITINEARRTLVRRRINISPSEVDALAEKIKAQNFNEVKYKISQIQINMTSDKTKEDVEQEAQDIANRLRSGENFATLAYTHSNGEKALQGGDWGWMQIEEMPTIFAEQIGLNSKGAIIGPFISGIGAHVLRIDDIEGSQRVTVTEIKSQHILIKPSIILSDRGAAQQLHEFSQDIKEGKHTFGELAQQHSQDPGSAINDGILDYQTSDNFVPEFKARLDQLPIGEISSPFKTQFGWHIVKVLDKRTVDKTEDAIKDQAYNILMTRKFNEEASAWLQELRASAYVEMK